MSRERRPFVHRMTGLQTALGWLFLPIDLLVLPLVLNIWAATARETPDPLTVNAVYVTIGVAFTVLVMFSFLRKGFDVLCDHFSDCLRTLLLAFGAALALGFCVNLLFYLWRGGLDNPNSAAVSELAETNGGAITALAVLLAPMVEEVLCRGVVFGTLRPKHPVLAYALSALVFGLAHVWQYAVAYRDPFQLVYVLQYLPVALCLAWCYDRSGSIWVPIFFHMGYNALALLG